MALTLITQPHGNVTAQNDRGLYRKLLSNDGVLWGCNATKYGTNKVEIAAGEMIVCGGIISNSTSYTTEEISASALSTYSKMSLVLTIDVNTGLILTWVGGDNPNLIQGDINNPTSGATTYQMRLLVVNIANRVIESIQQIPNATYGGDGQMNKLEIKNAVVPATTETGNLGTENLRFNLAFLKNANISGLARIGEIICTGKFTARGGNNTDNIVVNNSNTTVNGTLTYAPSVRKDTAGTSASTLTYSYIFRIAGGLFVNLKGSGIGLAQDSAIFNIGYTLKEQYQFPAYAQTSANGPFVRCQGIIHEEGGVYFKLGGVASGTTFTNVEFQTIIPESLLK